MTTHYTFCNPWDRLGRYATSPPPPPLASRPAAGATTPQLESLEQPRGHPMPLDGVQEEVGPRGDGQSKGRPWQWPAGQTFRGDPVSRPPAASKKPSRPATLPSTRQAAVGAVGRPCPAPAGRPERGDPVRRLLQTYGRRRLLFARAFSTIWSPPAKGPHPHPRERARKRRAAAGQSYRG